MKPKTYWARAHVSPDTGECETESYNRNWSQLMPIHASTEREARGVLRERLSGWANPVARVQLFLPSGVGGLGVLAWDGPPSALVRLIVSPA